MSNVKRKDSKGRNLRLGESQRKDGRYVYKYTDMYGNHSLSMLGNLFRQTRHPLGNVKICH